MKLREEALELLEKLVKENFAGRDKRYEFPGLLKNPEDNFICEDEWFIHVPSCFNDCLDIAKTERIKDSKKEMVWTQGSRFCFHSGCVLYDSPKAYLNWRDAIKEIKFCISIIGAKNVTLLDNKRESGEVEFAILSPNSDKQSMKEIREFTLTQDEFVKFLIIGNPEIISM